VSKTVSINSIFYVTDKLGLVEIERWLRETLIRKSESSVIYPAPQDSLALYQEYLKRMNDLQVFIGARSVSNQGELEMLKGADAIKLLYRGICDRSVVLEVSKDGVSLIFRYLDRDFRDMITQGRIYLSDATANLSVVAAYLGVTPSDILVIQQVDHTPERVTITRVTGFGKVNNKTRDNRQPGIEAVRKTMPKNTGVVDFVGAIPKGDPLTVGWFSDSRGSNRLKDCDNLLLIGSPKANFGAKMDEYMILQPYNMPPEIYYSWSIQSEIHQAIGRIRANRRPDLNAEIVILTDDSLNYLKLYGFDVKDEHITKYMELGEISDMNESLGIRARVSVLLIYLKEEVLTKVRPRRNVKRSLPPTRNDEKLEELRKGLRMSRKNFQYAIGELQTYTEDMITGLINLSIAQIRDAFRGFADALGY
jgi:hypothetical protein